MLRSLSRKLISCSIGRAYVPASWGRLITVVVIYLSCRVWLFPARTVPMEYLEHRQFPTGIDWLTCHCIEVSERNPQPKPKSKKFIQLSQNLIAFYSRFMFEKLWGFPTCMITHYEGFKILPVKLTNSSMSFTFNGTCTIPQRW